LCNDQRPKRQEAPKSVGAIIYGDLCHARREVFLTGRITEQLAKEVVAQLLYLECREPGLPITLMISSGGGKVTAGMAIHDVMRGLQSPVRTICLGRCSSMAAVLLAAGEPGERLAAPNCRVMVHQPRVSLPGKRGPRELGIQHDQIELSNATLQRLLQEYSGLPPEKVEELLQAGCYMSAEEAVRLGFADSVAALAAGPPGRRRAMLPLFLRLFLSLHRKLHLKLCLHRKLHLKLCLHQKLHLKLCLHLKLHPSLHLSLHLKLLRNQRLQWKQLHHLQLRQTLTTVALRQCWRS